MSRKTCHFSVRFPPREIRQKKDYVYHTNKTIKISKKLSFLLQEDVNRIPCIVTGVRVEWRMYPRVWTCSNSKSPQFQIHDQNLRNGQPSLRFQYEYTVRHKVDALTHISDEGRARLTISLGKLSRSVIPGDFRMGEPNMVNPYYLLSRRTPSELKYLSNWGKEIKRDSVSSDERKRISLNSWCVKR